MFSKLAWCVPLKNKSAASLVIAFTQLLGNMTTDTLQIDKGTEFLNRLLQKLIKEHGVHHFATHNEETKASIVEWFNQTLKIRRWRYFTEKPVGSIRRRPAGLYAIVNDTYHRISGVAPSEVNSTNQETVWQQLYGHESGGRPKFIVGNRVRISKAKRHFEKGYKLDRIYVYEHQPLTSLVSGGGGAIEFMLPGTGDAYLDLANTYLIRAIVVRVVGTDLAADTPVAPVNNWLNYLFSQVDVCLKDTLVTPSSNTYPFRVYVDTVLSYGAEGKNTQLTSQLW